MKKGNPTQKAHNEELQTASDFNYASEPTKVLIKDLQILASSKHLSEEQSALANEAAARLIHFDNLVNAVFNVPYPWIS